VAEEGGVTKKDARIVIGTVLDGVSKGLKEDGKVTLVDFGTFSVVERKARKARNPQTGEEIDVPAKRVPKFKASKALKTSVEG
jgi:DNA-binding protein HU-beta